MTVQQIKLKTASQKTAEDITALLRARNPLLWIVTREEARVETFLWPAAGAAGYRAYSWDCAAGMCNMDGTPAPYGSADIGDTLGTIANRAAGQERTDKERAVFILRDLPPWLAGPIGIVTVRQMRNLARRLPTLPRESAMAMIVLSPSADIPPELQQHATLIEWPMPDRAEIGVLLDAAMDSTASMPEDKRPSPLTNGERDKAIEAAVGLSGEEAQATYAKSLVQLRRIDAAAVAAEKKRIVKREGVLEWFDPLPGGLAAVGGLDNLKAWLLQRGNAYSKAARDYGLPLPKGVLLVGVPGCGKSLTAKAIATAWNVPLLRVDLGALKSKFVGESEGNLRRAFRVIEAIGRCVVWFDELEKALAGATQGAADGGVSSDALGGVLSWMQDRTGEAFVVATANDVSKLPPELTRKGRFDELFFIDLPNAQERAEILVATLRGFDRQPITDTASKALQPVIIASEGFTGSEVAEVVKDALYTAFNDNGRNLMPDDLAAACKAVYPLKNSAAEKIAALRAWSTRARPATAPRDGAGQVIEQRAPFARGRLVDVE